MCGPVRLAGVVALGFLVCCLTHAAEGPASFVPWRVLEPGAEPVASMFTLFWIPASAEEMRRSDLLTARRLTLYSGRCIGMQVIRADDKTMLARLRAGDSLPLAVLTEGGREMSRVLGGVEGLRASAVEGIIRQAFDRRETSLRILLDQAGAKAAGGETAAAIDLYRRVAGQRCAFPRLGKTAQRALRRLGVN